MTSQATGECVQLAVRAMCIAAGLALSVLFVAPASASATTFFVDRSDDSSGGACVFLTDNDCSLRSAINLANLSPEHDSIIFKLNLDPITLSGAAGEDLNASGDLDITQPLTISGRGVDETTITTISADHVIEVVGASLTLEDMRITLGSSVTGGCISAGGYTSDHELLLDSVILSGCAASSSGGALRIDSDDSDFPGLLTIRDSLFLNNSVLGDSTQGGAILIADTETAIDRTSFVNNAQRLSSGGPGFGGAIRAGGSEIPLVIRNSTFYGNHSTGSGGAISSSMLTTITGSTFVANRSDEENDGAGASTVSAIGAGVGNSYFAGNTTDGGTASDICSGGAYSDLGNNLVSSAEFAATCGLALATNIVDTEVGAPALVDFGGTRQAVSLTATSRALDAGSAALCAGFTTDTLGNPRSVGTCDIGAFELQDQADLAASALSFANASIAEGASTSFTGQISNTGPSSVGSSQVTLSLPTGLTVTDVSIDGMACTGTTTVTCTFASLASGSTKSISGSVKGDKAGTASVTLAVSTPGIDRNLANNSTSGSVIVTAAPVARPTLSVRGRSFKLAKSGRVVLPVRCNGTTGSRCQVALTMHTTKRIAGKRKWSVRCSAVNPMVGRFTQVKCKLPSKLRSGIRRNKRVKMKLVGTVKVGSDRRAMSPLTITVRR